MRAQRHAVKIKQVYRIPIKTKIHDTYYDIKSYFTIVLLTDWEIGFFEYLSVLFIHLFHRLKIENA